MNKDIKNICNQAGNKLNALARIAKFLDGSKRKLLMNSFVLSQFNYCPIIWMYCQRQSNNLINKIHERALRIAYNDYVSSFETLLEREGSISIHQKNIETLATEIFKTKNDLKPKLYEKHFLSSWPQIQHKTSKSFISKSQDCILWTRNIRIQSQSNMELLVK